MSIFLALLLDLLFGDPPNRVHPVAWMGNAIALTKGLAPASARARLRYGAGVTLLGAFSAGLTARVIDRKLPNTPAGYVIQALLLKFALAWQGLARAAGQVETALEAGRLDEARRLVGWHLVSRDTAELTGGLVAAATIESVAENLSDSVVAPLCYYALGGLPAVWAYRFVNTADAMIGYRDAEHYELGRAAALLDDFLNVVPARLTALLIAIAAGIQHKSAESASRAWRTASQFQGETDSPNAGWPMSAMAGALGVSLEKVRHYTLGDGPPPQPPDIGRAVRVAGIGALLACGLASLLNELVSGNRR